MSTRTPPLSQPQREQRFSNGGFDLSTLGPWRAVCFTWVSGKPNSSTDYEAILPSPLSIVLKGFMTGSDPELINNFPVTGNRSSSNLPLGGSVTFVGYHGALLSMLSVRTWLQFVGPLIGLVLSKGTSALSQPAGLSDTQVNAASSRAAALSLITGREPVISLDGLGASIPVTIPGGLRGISLVGALRSIVETMRSPGEILAGLNRRLVSSISNPSISYRLIRCVRLIYLSLINRNRLDRRSSVPASRKRKYVF